MYIYVRASATVQCDRSRITRTLFVERSINSVRCFRLVLHGNRDSASEKYSYTETGIREHAKLGLNRFFKFEFVCSTRRVRTCMRSRTVSSGLLRAVTLVNTFHVRKDKKKHTRRERRGKYARTELLVFSTVQHYVYTCGLLKRHKNLTGHREQ